MSRWLYPFERTVARERLRRLAIVTLAAFVVVNFLDGPLYRAIAVDPDRKAVVEGRDWYRTLRVVGTLWLWAPLCLAWALAARARDAAANAGRVFLAAILSGALAEVLQAAIGRRRPDATDGRHEFKGLIERFTDPDGLGLPSSHAAVAFGAACMVAYLHPRAGVVALAAAVGCGWTRMLAGAHFASDVLGALIVGYAVARLLRPGGWHGAGRGLLLP